MFYNSLCYYILLALKLGKGFTGFFFAFYGKAVSMEDLMHEKCYGGQSDRRGARTFISPIKDSLCTINRTAM